jgi:simple sugar transport system permease protein
MLAMLNIPARHAVDATSGRMLFDLPDGFYALMTVSLGGLPLAVWFAALAFAVAGVMPRVRELDPDS